MNKKTALLVIDMQNDFIEEGAIIEVRGIRKNLTILRDFIEGCREKRITIIYTKHIFDPVNNPIEAKLFPELAKEGLRDCSRGTEVHAALKPLDDDVVIKKRRFDAFIGTKLELMLKSKGIENVIIAGTMTNVCCESTARTAMMKDFNVLFCSDLTFTSDPDAHNNTLKNISTHFGKVMKSEDILRFLK